MEWGLFEDCRALGEIIIPPGADGIGPNAFRGCSSLRHVTLPDGLSFIGSNAFSGCIALREIAIPESITLIGEGVFDGCGVTVYCAAYSSAHGWCAAHNIPYVLT